jgi:putative protease
MTSRLCLLHQVIGCSKTLMDKTCLTDCEKSSFITNLKNQTSFVVKTKGNHHELYNETHYLNTSIVTDIPNLFCNYMVDLRDIKTQTQISEPKSRLIGLFKNLLLNRPATQEAIEQAISPSCNNQYKKGI